MAGLTGNENHGTRSEAAADVGRAMAELEALMCAVAVGTLPNRGEATAYSQARTDLLAAGHLALPGFVHQCLTVFKFREFITLYDPEPAAREGFVRRAFDRCRAASGERAGPAANGGARSPLWRS